MNDTRYAGLSPEVRAFRPRCPGCTPRALSAPGQRPCSFYDCPGLPDALRVTCDSCMYDFAKGDGQVKCDHATCDKALELQSNVATYRTWLALISDGTASPG